MNTDLVNAMESGAYALIREGKYDLAVLLMSQTFLARETDAHETFLRTFGADGVVEPTSLDAYRHLGAA